MSCDNCCLVTAMPLACRLAARLGGGNLVAPVQRVTDFLAGQLSSGTLPSSSYRSVLQQQGVRPNPNYIKLDRA